MLRVIELFGGIGAVHSALDRELGKHEFEVIDMVENSKTAIKAYNAIHDTQFEAQDVLTWDKDIRCDYLHASTPCQAFSTNGLNQGAEDKRGLPLWEATIRIINKTKPMIVTLENVKGLLSKKHKPVVNYFLSEMDKLGYKIQYFIFNAKEFGVPQNRERVFFIAIKDKLLSQVTNNNNFFDRFTSARMRKVYPDKYLKDILENNSHWFSDRATIQEDTEYVYIRNQMSLYKDNVIEINLDKALNQEPNKEINIIAILKDMKWDNFSPNSFVVSNHKIETLDNYKFISGGARYNATKGISQTINRHDLNDNSIMRVNVFPTLEEELEVKVLNDYPHASTKGQYGVNGSIRTLDTRSVGQLSLFDVSFNEDSNFKAENGVSGTITATNPYFKNKVMNMWPIGASQILITYKKLSALECSRLMGYDDEDYYSMVKVGLSNNQIGKLLGNSIVVNVMQFIIHCFNGG